MKNKLYLRNELKQVSQFFLFCLAILIFTTSTTLGQSVNSVSGYIFSINRSPLTDMNVELMDDMNRTIARARTDGSGRYFFGGLAFGVFRIKVFSSGTDFAEQTQQIDISSFTGRSSDTQRVNLDFYMKPRKIVSVGIPSAIFAQEVPESAKKLYEKAISEIDKKNTDAGIQLLNQSLTIFPDYLMALSKLGYEYARLQKYDLAVKSLVKAVSINQKDFTNWHTLSYCYFTLNKIPESLDSVEKALNINQSSVEALLLYGIILRKAQRFEDAEKQLLSAKKYSKDKNPDVHWYLALLYGNNLKKYNLAADALELYLKYQPDAKDAENIKKLIQQYRQKIN